MPETTAQTALLDALTPKQREVIGYVAEGLTSKEIARKINGSESAVNQRIELIRQRMSGLPRSQIARLYRQQRTLLLTIPTSKSLTGNPMPVRDPYGARQAAEVEGTAIPGSPRAAANDSVLQPSTIFQTLNGPAGGWFRLGAIVLLALGLAATALLVLAVAETLHDISAAKG